MKRSLFLLPLLLLFNVFQSKAQEKSKDTTLYKKPKIKQRKVPVYLGYSDWNKGMIPKHVFDSLAMQGLTARDSVGNQGQVLEFRLYYKERNLYEDSLGNYYFSMDLLTDFSKSNKLNNYMGNSLMDRTKRGDTAIFDDILVKMPDSAVIRGIPMKLVIDK